MPKQKELITAQQARKILGCTTENLRSLSKEGIISSVKVNTGKKTTIYYFEEEIQKRKSLSTEILIRAKRADECIRNSKRLYREALAKEKEAIERLKTSSNWKRRQERFGDLLLAVIRKLDGYSTLSLRDKKILKDLISLKPISTIADENNIGIEQVDNILRKSIKVVSRGTNLATENVKLEEEVCILKHENMRLKVELGELDGDLSKKPKKEKSALRGEDLSKYYLLTENVSILFNKWETTILKILSHNGISSVRDLVMKNKEDLSEYFSRRNVERIGYVLESRGLSLGMDLTNIGIRFPNDGGNELDTLNIMIKQKLSLPIANCGLSVRVIGCCKSAGVKTIGDLVQYSRKELLEWKNFGRTSLKEIDALIERLDLSYEMDVDKYGILKEFVKRRRPLM